jgi:hypothetical protein
VAVQQIQHMKTLSLTNAVSTLQSPVPTHDERCMKSLFSSVDSLMARIV